MQKPLSNTDSFNITVGEFQGSLEALLKMVQKRKMNISDVSLAGVANEYMEYVKHLQMSTGISASQETANFIVIAATLLLIKSKSLLPTLELTLDEEEDIKDLEERLKLYSMYKKATDALAIHTKNTAQLYAPKRIRSSQPIIFTATQGLNLGVVSEAMQSLLGQLPKVENKPKAEIVESINIEEVMQSLFKRVEASVQQNFTQMVGGKSAKKQDVLVHFLALLELVKDGVLLVAQEDTYGDILITQ